MVKRYGDSDAWKAAELDLIEHEFHGLDVRGHPFDGKIDRVDAKAGDAGHRRIVDYKTGQPKLREQMYFDDRLQLALYREAAARRTGNEAFDLEFHFLRDGSVVRLELSGSDIARTLTAASMSANEIHEVLANRKFVAKPSVWACPSCAYRPVCDEGQAAVGSGAIVPNAVPALPVKQDEDEIPF